MSHFHFTHSLSATSPADSQLPTLRLDNQTCQPRRQVQRQHQYTGYQRSLMDRPIHPAPTPCISAATKPSSYHQQPHQLHQPQNDHQQVFQQFGCTSRFYLHQHQDQCLDRKRAHNHIYNFPLASCVSGELSAQPQGEGTGQVLPDIPHIGTSSSAQEQQAFGTNKEEGTTTRRA